MDHKTAAPIGALLCAALLLFAAPSAHAFDPQNKNRPELQIPGQKQQPRYRERTPSELYPRNERDRSALQQLMRHDRARRAVEQGTIRPLDEIRGQVRRKFNGRIVGIELHENRGRNPRNWIYDVRVLTRDGDVMAVEMDARTGQVMSVKGQR